ncbi:TonB C-terminal domain-containing protein [Undibacterium sp.]
MKSQNKKTRPEKQVKQEKLPGEQGQLAKAGDAVSTTSVTTATAVAVTATSSSAKNSSGKLASIEVRTERANYEKLIFTVAITASLVLHALALLVHFVMPKTVDNKPRDADLEIILVNSKHAKRPVNAEALAQADLDGGGAHDSGRSKSPLPDMKRSEDGDALQTNTRKIAELEEQQKQLMDQAKLKDDFRQQKQEKKNTDEKPRPSTGEDSVDTTKALARMAAEISQTIEDQNKRPRKTYITPSTKRLDHAIYYKAVQKRIEDTGTLNFPQKDGKKLYGEMFVSIPIYQDGTIYEKEGGPRIEVSSGDKALDAAALRIVRRSGPFGHYPKASLGPNSNEVFIMFARFKFTREQQLETELRKGPN